MCCTPAALSCCTNRAPPVPFTSRIAAGAAAAWPKGASDCATDLAATVLIPSALRPVINCRRDMPLSRYCLISSFMTFSSPACLFSVAPDGAQRHPGNVPSFATLHPGYELEPTIARPSRHPPRPSQEDGEESRSARIARDSFHRSDTALAP